MDTKQPLSIEDSIEVISGENWDCVVTNEDTHVSLTDPFEYEVVCIDYAQIPELIEVLQAILKRNS